MGKEMVADSMNSVMASSDLKISSVLGSTGGGNEEQHLEDEKMECGDQGR